MAVTEKISIEGLDKAAVLAALYNASRPQGMGFLQYDPTPMTKEDAQQLLDAYPQANFDYLKGRVMKVDLSSDEFSPFSYDRDNGPGAAEQALQALRLSGDVNPISVQVAHEDGKHRAADILREHLPGKTTIKEFPGGVEFNLGLDDVADTLGIVLDAKTRDESEPQDFAKLAKEGERIHMNDDISCMIYKISEGDREAMDLLKRMLDQDDFMMVLGLDSMHLYGRRITQLYEEVCGSDYDRFLYHLQMELPNQGTGQLFITGPYAASMSQEEANAHFAARKFGKPGSFWALETPPTDPNYEYPIKV